MLDAAALTESVFSGLQDSTDNPNGFAAWTAGLSSEQLLGRSQPLIDQALGGYDPSVTLDNLLSQLPATAPTSITALGAALDAIEGVTVQDVFESSTNAELDLVLLGQATLGVPVSVATPGLSLEVTGQLDVTVDLR